MPADTACVARRSRPVLNVDCKPPASSCPSASPLRPATSFARSDPVWPSRAAICPEYAAAFERPYRFYPSVGPLRRGRFVLTSRSSFADQVRLSHGGRVPRARCALLIFPDSFRQWLAKVRLPHRLNDRRGRGLPRLAVAIFRDRVGSLAPTASDNRSRSPSVPFTRSAFRHLLTSPRLTPQASATSLADSRLTARTSEPHKTGMRCPQTTPKGHCCGASLIATMRRLPPSTGWEFLRRSQSALGPDPSGRRSAGIDSKYLRMVCRCPRGIGSFSSTDSVSLLYLANFSLYSR